MPVDPAKITEFVNHSWYEYSDGDANGKHPSQGETNPKYSGPKPPYDFLDVDKKYSWLKTPRYDGKPMEVGPLARMVVGYASGQTGDQGSRSTALLKKLNAPPAVLFSTLGRIAARALESQIMARHLEAWVDRAASNLAHGKVAIFNPVRWDPAPGRNPPPATAGMRLRAARSAIGSRSKANRSRTIRPWFPPPGTRVRAIAQGQRGAYEASLLNTPVADPDRPLEILRTIHSFDPCIACAVHVIDATGREYTIPARRVCQREEAL